MKKMLKKIMACGVMIASATTMSAQQQASRSAYFLDGYTFRHQLNPAFEGEYNYISVPGVANIGASVESNVSIGDFIYEKTDGRLTTFMNSSVDGRDFISSLSTSNVITANANVTLASFGFRAFKGFNTVSISARADAGVALPSDLFKFMKLGQESSYTVYDLSGIRVSAKAYSEVALGHQHNINNEFSVGAKLKFLVGAAYADGKVDNMKVTMNYSRWEVSGEGQLELSGGKNLYVPTNSEVGKQSEYPQRANQISFDDVDYRWSDIRPTGFGVSTDLGVVWNLDKYAGGLKVAASVLDLGFINWKNVIRANTPGTTWTFNGFNEVAVDSSQPNYETDKIATQFDNMKDDFIDCMNLQRTSTNGSKLSMLKATLTLGAEYEMPFYRALSGGFLFTHYFAGPFSLTENRISANIKPVKWFNASATGAFSTYGFAFGWMLNFHPRGVNFFVGSDYQFFKITPQFIPTGRAATAVNVGLSVTFGARKS